MQQNCSEIAGNSMERRKSLPYAANANIDEAIMELGDILREVKRISEQDLSTAEIYKAILRIQGRAADSVVLLKEIKRGGRDE